MAVILFIGGATEVVHAQNQPPPAATGPGGTNYFFQSIATNDFGVGANEFWIFEPRSPQPASAPLIVFNHGYNATNPVFYAGWIRHIVQRGNIVIYPRYQSNSISPVSLKYFGNAVAAVTNAIEWLQTNGSSTLPQLDKFAIVGHSVGGLLTANMAALAAANNLPQARAAMCCQPGLSTEQPGGTVPLADLSQLPTNLLLLTVAGAEDGLVGSIDASNILFQSSNVPFTNKDFLLFRSDYHNPSAPLVSNHLMSNCGDFGGPDAPDTLDYRGLWKLFDALTDAAFYSSNRNFALGGGTNATSLGNWSDGAPINPLVSYANPISLVAQRANSQLLLSWIPPFANYQLQTNTTLSATTGAWSNAAPLIIPTNGQYSLTQNLNGHQMFFRLFGQ